MTLKANTVVVVLFQCKEVVGASMTLKANTVVVVKFQCKDE